MKTKISLSIKKTLILRGKEYAKQSNQSLSQIIESYLERITSEDPSFGDEELDSIRGVISLPKSFNLNEEIGKVKSQ